MNPGNWSLKWTLVAWTFGLGLLFSAVIVLPTLADEDGRFQAGVRLFGCGQYAAAINYFEAFRKDSPYDARILYYEGLCHHRMGQLGAARSCYQQVVDKFPDSDAAEMAKKGLGIVEFGSGYDRPGGSLAKLDKLRMDVIPAEATINCQERDGKPMVEVSVDGKKMEFIVDATANNTSIGADLVRAHSLNDVPVTAKAVKAARGAGEIKNAVSAKADVDTKDANVAKDTKDSKGASVAKDTKDSKGASVAKDTKDSKGTNVAKDTKDSKDQAGNKTATNNTSGATVVLYDVVLGPVQRPGFPVFITPAKPKQAVLGRDFLGPYKVTFNATAKTLSLVRDHSYENPFFAGMNLFNKGKYKLAVPLLKRACANRPQDPRMLYCYGAALQRAGAIDAAKVIYRQLNQRFPNSEANFYAVVALTAIDPSFTREVKQVKQDAQGNPVRTRKPNDTFDVPFSTENNYMKVSVYVDSQAVDMYVDTSRHDFLFSSPQLAAIDSSYLNDLQEISRTTDDTNVMFTVVTKKGTLKMVRLGSAIKRGAPMTVIDQGGLKFLANWSGQSQRPLFPLSMFNEWHYEIMTDLKVIRFTKFSGSS